MNTRIIYNKELKALLTRISKEIALKRDSQRFWEYKRYVQFVAHEGYFKITWLNRNEIGESQSIPSNTYMNSSCFVQFDTLKSILNNIPLNTAVVLNVDKYNLVISNDNTSTVIKTRDFDSDISEKFKPIESGIIIHVVDDTFQMALSSTREVANFSDKEYLQQIRFSWHDETHIILEATDGYRIDRWIIETEECDPFESFGVSPNTVFKNVIDFNKINKLDTSYPDTSKYHAYHAKFFKCDKQTIKEFARGVELTGLFSLETGFLWDHEYDPYSWGLYAEGENGDASHLVHSYHDNRFGDESIRIRNMTISWWVNNGFLAHIAKYASKTGYLTLNMNTDNSKPHEFSVSRNHIQIVMGMKIYGKEAKPAFTKEREYATI